MSWDINHDLYLGELNLIIQELNAKLNICEETLTDIFECMGGEERNGWNSPEDVWGIAKEALDNL